MQMDVMVGAEKKSAAVEGRERSRLGRALQKSCAALEKASEVSVKVASPICFGLLFGIVVVLLMEIFFRRVQIIDVSWSEELAKMLSVALAIISASIGFKKGYHIGFTYLLMKIKSPGLLSLLQIVTQLFISAFLFVAIYYGFVYAAAVSYQTAPSVRVSMFWPHLSVPIGSLMMIVHSLYFLAVSLKTLLAGGEGDWFLRGVSFHVARARNDFSRLFSLGDRRAHSLRAGYPLGLIHTDGGPQHNDRSLAHVRRG